MPSATARPPASRDPFKPVPQTVRIDPSWIAGRWVEPFGQIGLEAHFDFTESSPGTYTSDVTETGTPVANYGGGRLCLPVSITVHYVPAGKYEATGTYEGTMTRYTEAEEGTVAGGGAQDCVADGTTTINFGAEDQPDGSIPSVSIGCGEYSTTVNMAWICGTTGQFGGFGMMWRPSGPARVVPSACSSVIILGARGSGQSASDDGGLGPEVDVVANVIGDKLKARGASVEVRSVDYPADDVNGDLKLSTSEIRRIGVLLGIARIIHGPLKPDIEKVWGYYYHTHIAKFLASIKSGITALTSEIRKEVAACPLSQLVLAGYSQGAMVVHQAEAALREGSPQDLAHIGGTVLIADGDRVAGSDAAERLGGVPATDAGLRPYIYQWRQSDVPSPTDPPIPATTVEVCEKGDIVCDFDPLCADFTARCKAQLATRLLHSGRGIKIHTSYVSDHFALLSAAGSWISQLPRL